ncbi:lamin tail domain-containing protein [Agriterribacter sp.]|uniref:lamin tail domain-containing protein n=1 Tax=Agriterribacter sp. TaxID=2821509 RepID=UPI002CC8D3F6|nr:lamin tail domain-containing protein [Agriterribacter sp.]HTN06016.1 lamin tail domain-containing protein [Agriterribacter sp.]
MKNTLFCLLTLCCFLRIYAQQPARYNVLLHEIMANPPASASALPGSKYIELYNASPTAYDLYEWKISDGSDTAIIKEHFILLPGSFVIISSTGAMEALSAFGATIGVSHFPSLRVNGDMLWLLSDENILMHAVQYNRNWYDNEVKNAGGWSLEMIDTKNPCSGSSNWKASTDARGGTPGAPNSIAGNNKDETVPELLRAYTTDSLHFLLVFNESLDSLQGALKENYACSDGMIIERAAPQPPLFNTVQLKLDKPLAKNKVFTLQVKNVSDCSGNVISSSSVVKAGREEMPETGDIIINEILFNPPADGSDYVELYNRSNHIINAKTLHIAGRNSTGNINSIKQLNSEDLLIFPGDFVVVTDNAAAVKEQYIVKNTGALIAITTMPSYPNASGTVVLLNTLGEVMDELRYDEKWHFELISNYKGVALERIDYNQPAQDKNNWHSAAASAGYGTPTYQNSQFKANEQLQGKINISPGVFSPDNDGHDDFLTVAYRFPEPGYVCHITVFDTRGRAIRYLVRNGICGTEGYFRWNGLDEKKQQISMGIYVILTEVYNLNGRTKKFKQAVTLARLR